MSTRTKLGTSLTGPWKAMTSDMQGTADVVNPGLMVIATCDRFGASVNREHAQRIADALNAVESRDAR